MTLLIVCIEEIYCPNKKNTIKKKDHLLERKIIFLYNSITSHIVRIIQKILNLDLKNFSIHISSNIINEITCQLHYFQIKSFFLLLFSEFSKKL